MSQTFIGEKQTWESNLTDRHSRATSLTEIGEKSHRQTYERNLRDRHRRKSYRQTYHRNLADRHRREISQTDIG